MQRWLALILTVGTITLASCRLEAAAPELQREFRGVWVATVANIDWPSRKGLPTDTQKRELIAIFDRCHELNFNAVILQVRPMCDAMYPSKLEPWSEFLTGTMGKAPEPFYDPLEFAVVEAHKRGLELHTWFNPYRAQSPTARSPVADSHVVKRRPDLAPKYGKHHWMIPTEPEVMKQSMDVFLDVVKRYDVDGIHMDDYFYPYLEKDDAGTTIPFPDDESWKRYQSNGGTMARDDWRRDAVNRFVKELYVETKKVKPWVKVGISPFGIWRPGHPPGIKGFDQYAGLYADAKLWFNEGWVDYFTPQLYWSIARKEQSYPVLLKWWVGENSKHRHLWPGNISRTLAERNGQELLDEFDITRKLGAGGNVFFSMKSLQRNKTIETALKKVYAEPALIPGSNWLNPHGAPVTATLAGKRLGEDRIAVTLPTERQAAWLLIQSQNQGKWNAKLHFVSGKTNVELPLAGHTTGGITITALDRANVTMATTTIANN